MLDDPGGDGPARHTMAHGTRYKWGIIFGWDEDTGLVPIQLSDGGAMLFPPNYCILVIFALTSSVELMAA